MGPWGASKCLQEAPALPRLPLAFSPGSKLTRQKKTLFWGQLTYRTILAGVRSHRKFLWFARLNRDTLCLSHPIKPKEWQKYTHTHLLNQIAIQRTFDLMHFYRDSGKGRDYGQEGGIVRGVAWGIPDWGLIFRDLKDSLLLLCEPLITLLYLEMLADPWISMSRHPKNMAPKPYRSQPENIKWRYVQSCEGNSCGNTGSDVICIPTMTSYVLHQWRHTVSRNVSYPTLGRWSHYRFLGVS